MIKAVFKSAILSINQGKFKYKASKINNISPTFCIAKWTQVTIDLFNGETHSCHHPLRHDIPVKDLDENPSALHNTQIKIDARKQMIEGERPSECSYCWKIEDTNSYLKSDRIIKSSEDWAYPLRKKITSDPLDKKFSPSYIEVMFDNRCNFSCSYCTPRISSSIHSEMKKFGAYPLSLDQGHRMTMPISTNNDLQASYVEAFWRWFPSIQGDLHTFRVTGGEPLLSSETEKVIDYLLENPNKNLTFAINTNLCIRDSMFDSYLTKLKKLVETKSIKLLQIFTSFDSIGTQAEYIRYGLDYKKLIKNIKQISEIIPEAEIRVMTTFTILSIPKIYDFVAEIVSLRSLGIDIEFDISYLSDPRYLRANIGDRSVIEMFYNQVKLIQKDFIDKHLLHAKEVLKINRTLKWADSTFEEFENLEFRENFKIFVEEYDKRKNLTFDEIFPELVTFKNSIGN